MSAVFGDNAALIVASAGVILAVYFAAGRIFSQDPSEPPLAPQTIPIIGHLVGMARRGFNYHVDIRYVRFPLETSNQRSHLLPATR